MNSRISSFINRWRTSESATGESNDYAPAPGTEIRYSPELVGKFEQEHQRFFALHGAILDAQERRELSAIPPLMNEFEALLTGHLLSERVRLYAYMDAYFSADQKTRTMLREYRTEMDRIGDSVMQLFRKYRNIETDSTLTQTFNRDFEELGKILAERMQREESILYPLYMPVAS